MPANRHGIGFSLLVLPAALVVLCCSGRLSHAQDQDAPEHPSARWEDDIAKFEEQDKASPPAQGGVLFVGSSSIRLWKLDKAFPEKGYINRGFGGSQLADSVYFFDRIVKPYKPRLIVLYAGDNDLANEKTPCQVAADFQAFVDRMHAELPETKLIYIAIKPSLRRWNIVHKGQAANAVINAICVDDEKLTFVDIAPPMLLEDGTPNPDLFLPDGLHLNLKGYTLWKQQLEPHLQ
jgi:lysophospholipase L1-like esterase